jgi:hypothetical protein
MNKSACDIKDPRLADKDNQFIEERVMANEAHNMLPRSRLGTC